jgi:arylsulfatase A-like enzyme
MTMISEKLKQAKYATHVAGKWHGGGYAYGQLPTQRGFDSHLGYLNGEEDHWTQVRNYRYRIADQIVRTA